MKRDNLLTTGEWVSIIWITISIFIVLFALWIWAMVYASRKKGALGFCLVFFLGFIGWLIVLFLPADSERERDEIYLRGLLCQVSGGITRGRNRSGRKSLSLLFRKEAAWSNLNL